MRNLIFIALVAVITGCYGQKGNFSKSKKTSSIEVYYQGNSAHVDVPGLLSGLVSTAESGPGSDFGVGIVSRYKRFEFRGGLHYWNHPFAATVIINDNEDYAKEKANIKYLGPYLRFNFASDYFFAGGGFDFSFYRNFSGIRRTYVNDALTKTETGINSSYHFDKVNQAASLTFDFGFKIPTRLGLKIKPIFEISLPLAAIFPKQEVADIINNSQVHIYYEDPARVGIQYFPSWSYGLVFEF